MELGIPSNIWNCRMDTSGRIVIPRQLRSEKDFQPRDEIAICRVGNQFVLRRSDENLDQLLAAFRANIPEGASLVDELTAERHAEAEREKASH